MFRVVRKLKELFHAGAVRLSSGPGAFGLYQFDRRECCATRPTSASPRIGVLFGHGNIAGRRDDASNVDFTISSPTSANQVALFWRDKRISDVVGERAA